ncbi:hypothetical protein CPB84DRAFT_1543713 [Gymnopilus junonius]|uniref:Uncharacterized protein n=1 Tax=Gymnopilus junonius TaxID=109634 RepID=A0A9P5NHE9_GYMJU|nr:hypothetical protein CPB84DRAFT_1543713 [Gymnopilus junonius]
MPYHYRSVEIMWNNLTVRNFDPIVVNECIELIKHAPCLTFLTLLDISQPSEEDFQFPDVTIVHEQLLKIQMTSMIIDDEYMRMFLSVTLPHLHNLYMCPTPMPADALIDLLERSACSLESLHMLAIGWHPLDPEFSAEMTAVFSLAAHPCQRLLALTTNNPYDQNTHRSCPESPTTHISNNGTPQSPGGIQQYAQQYPLYPQAESPRTHPSSTSHGHLQR